MAERKLTPKQQRFIVEYLKDGNASRAYRKAYDTRSGNDATVGRSAHALLNNPKVAAKIESFRAELRRKAEITVESHLAELAEIAMLAKIDGKYGPAAACEVARGRVSGFYVEKVQLEVTLRGFAERMRNRAKKEKP